MGRQRSHARLAGAHATLGAVRGMSLRSRIFLANAGVTVAAAVVLLVTPATVSSPVHLRELAVVVGGLAAMLLMNVFLLRRTFAPLERLTSMMRGVELLKPGGRVPVYGDDMEIVELTRAFNEMLDRLEDERRQSVRRSLDAQESERRRVAQELHDEVGQSLTAVILQIERSVRSCTPELRPQLEEARETARTSLEDVRAISKRLRPEALDDLGLASALAALTARLSDRTGARIDRRIEPALSALTPTAELVIYRVAQEALTNALRHAGASRIVLRLSSEQGGTALLVSDDGRGLNGFRPGAGVQGMRERALMIGARLDIEDAPDGGTRVRLTVPSAGQV